MGLGVGEIVMNNINNNSNINFDTQYLTFNLAATRGGIFPLMGMDAYQNKLNGVSFRCFLTTTNTLIRLY